MVKIYAIRNKTSNSVYIGSTTQKYLCKRFWVHKTKPTTTSSEIIKCETAYIELLEECDDEKRVERERYWIENTEHCINRRIPGRKWKEWREVNRDKNNQYMRNYMKVRYWQNKIQV